MGKGLKAPLGRVELHAREPLDSAGLGLRLRHVFVQPDGLQDLIAHAHDGIQARGRFLKDHRDARAAQALHGFFGEAHQVLPAHLHPPLRHKDALGQQAHEREGRQGLAAARLAHEGEALAPFNIKGDVRDGRHRLPSSDAHREVFDA